MFHCTSLSWKWSWLWTFHGLSEVALIDMGRSLLLFAHVLAVGRFSHSQSRWERWYLNLSLPWWSAVFLRCLHQTVMAACFGRSWSGSSQIVEMFRTHRCCLCFLSDWVLGLPFAFLDAGAVNLVFQASVAGNRMFRSQDDSFPDDSFLSKSFLIRNRNMKYAQTIKIVVSVFIHIYL